MDRGELGGAVARAIADNYWHVVDASDGHPSLVEDPDRAAAAAIRVVLAEVGRELEALPARSFAHTLDASRLWVARGDVLAALSALVPPPPV